MRSRRNNLLFFGISESKDEDVEEKVLSFFKDNLHIEGDRKSFGIQRAHRLGAPRRDNIGQHAARPRPIIVCFSDFKMKENIRSKRYSLTAPFGIANDLPLAVRNAQKSLIPQLKEVKKTNERAAIIYPARIVSHGKILGEADVAKFVSE